MSVRGSRNGPNGPVAPLTGDGTRALRTSVRTTPPGPPKILVIVSHGPPLRHHSSRAASHPTMRNGEVPLPEYPAQRGQRAQERARDPGVTTGLHAPKPPLPRIRSTDRSYPWSGRPQVDSRPSGKPSAAHDRDRVDEQAARC